MTVITGWRSQQAKKPSSLGAKRDPSLITPKTIKRLEPNDTRNAFTQPVPGHCAMPGRLMGKASS